MASYFLDSSALVKYYHTEAGSAEVNRLIHELNARHYISRLITVEVASAFAVKTRTGDLDARDFVPLLRRFLRDVAQRQFQVLRMTNAHYEAAVEIIEKYFQRRLRTLDALHFAVALDLRRRGILDHFVCADESLCSIAIEEGATSTSFDGFELSPKAAYGLAFPCPGTGLSAG
jgi:predicted nucleic acid-binding protein